MLMMEIYRLCRHNHVVIDRLQVAILIVLCKERHVISTFSHIFLKHFMDLSRNLIKAKRLGCSKNDVGFNLEP